MKSREFLLKPHLMLCLLLAGTTFLPAATVTWTGGGDGIFWIDANNWDTGMVPTAADQVVLGPMANVLLTGNETVDQLILTDNATLTIGNGSSLTLPSPAILPGDRINISGTSSINILGAITVTGGNSNGIEASGSSTVNNNGSVMLNETGSESIFLFDDAIWNNYVSLTITESDDDGIDMEGNAIFNNQGSVSLIDIEAEGIDMDDAPQFNNYGTIYIEGIAGNDGIDIDDSNSIFTNYNRIEIVTVTEGGEGIEVDDGQFINTSTGIITMEGVTGEGIRLEPDGSFTNNGYVNIDHIPDAITNDIIEIGCGCVFQNTGIVEMISTGSSDAIQLQCDGVFLNESCGGVYILSDKRIAIETSNGAFTNEGYLFSAFTGTNPNQGTFTNNGLIEDPDGFMISPNAVVGSPGTTQDMEAPSITCPADIMVTTDCIAAMEIVEYTEPEGMDNCNVYSVSCDIASGSSFGPGTTTVTCTVTDQAGNTNNCTFDVIVSQSVVDDPVPAVTDKAFCQNDELAANLANTGLSVENTLAADEKVVWVLTGKPDGSAYTIGDEFTTDDCGSGFKDFGELAVANTSRVIRVNDPGSAPVGVYTFEAYVMNCTSGCTSMPVSTFTIEVFAAPTVMITADPDGDLCLGQMDVQYDANLMASDDGTYSYLWCAYNSGDGSGTCFNGFDDNTAAMPTRDWTSSAGPKSVGVTVMSDVPGCEAEGLYSFNVVAPTIVECPMDMMGTLITDDMTFECAATFNWDHPEVLPGPCDPVTLTITISGGSVAVGPDAVTPGTPYSFTFEELGVFTVTYDLVDAVGNMSSCSFTITVDGLPCGWVDNGGIGCADNLNSSSYDQGTETFTLTANNCALTGWPYSSDQLAFVFTELCGDGEIVAQVTSIDATGFAGVMMRDSEAPDAPMMAMGTNTINKVLKQVRILPGYPAFPQFVLSYDQFWVRIVRQGNQFMGFASTDGVSWVMYLNQQVFVSNNCLRVGMFTYSEKPGNPITATFDNVSVTEYGSSLVQLPGSTIQNGSSEAMLDLEIFPNPTHGIVNVVLAAEQSEQPVELHIFNAVGQLIQRKELDATNGLQQTIDLSDQTPGMYFFHLRQANGELQIEKVILK